MAVTIVGGNKCNSISTWISTRLFISLLGSRPEILGRSQLIGSNPEDNWCLLYLPRFDEKKSGPYWYFNIECKTGELPLRSVSCVLSFSSSSLYYIFSTLCPRAESFEWEGDVSFRFVNVWHKGKCGVW